VDHFDQARDIIVDALEERDWDISEEGLEDIAERLRGYFPSIEQAFEFVEAHASQLVDMMEETGARRSRESRRTTKPRFVEE